MPSVTWAFGPPLCMKVPRICHSERSEESAFLHFQKQILRRFAPQNDKQGLTFDGESVARYLQRQGLFSRACQGTGRSLLKWQTAEAGRRGGGRGRTWDRDFCIHTEPMLESRRFQASRC